MAFDSGGAESWKCPQILGKFALMQSDDSGGEAPQQQKIHDGYGAKYHRIYAVVLPIPVAKLRRAMRDLQADPNRFSPQALATFEKVRGEAGRLAPDDEFMVHISGPWDGPVRVDCTDDDAFCLVTLEGHLEAGEIHFRIQELTPETSRFEIESLARSRDVIVDFIYDKLPLAKFVQTEMWNAFCKNFAEHAAELAGASKDVIPEVEILTERCDEKTGQWQKI